MPTVEQFLEQILRPTLRSNENNTLQAQSGCSSNDLANSDVTQAVEQPPTGVNGGAPLFQQELLAIVPDVSDELGYQLFWDKYTLEYPTQLDLADADFSLTEWVGMDPG